MEDSYVDAIGLYIVQEETDEMIFMECGATWNLDVSTEKRE